MYFSPYIMINGINLTITIKKIKRKNHDRIKEK
jgi:hypothetical protein